MAEPLPDRDRNSNSAADPLLSGAFEPGLWLVPDSGCPPEYVGVPEWELLAPLDAARQERAATITGESLPAGFLSRTLPTRSQLGSGFESGGALDTRPPDGLLAALADSALQDGSLAGLDDDELIGVMRACRRVESWASANRLSAVAELARRRPAGKIPRPAPGELPEQVSEFAVDEIAAALTLTSQAASTALALSMDLAVRLPATFRAHYDGVIDYPKVRLIAEATRILSDGDARQVEAQILPKAGSQTTGQLRAAVARAVTAVDPDAAIERRENAQKDPRVRRWREDAGTAALAGYGLPPADVLAADQQLTARAHALRDAGLPGTVEELRARAYLDALLDRDSTPPAAPTGPRAPAPASPDSGPDPDPDPDTSPSLSPTAPPAPALAPGRSPHPPGMLINLTVPLTTQLGLTDDPGLVAGFGPVDGPLARHLTGRTAASPRIRCCLTFTGPDGQAIGHGCLPGSGTLAELGTQPLTVTIHPLARGSCDHTHAEPGYQPSRKLRHLISARTPTCTAPGCRQPAARCDLDHSVPYEQGGRTCECNLAPLCRHHHRCKQADGWYLEQSRPGVMHWTTPAGRHYTTTPDAYP